MARRATETLRRGRVTGVWVDRLLSTGRLVLAVWTGASFLVGGREGGIVGGTGDVVHPVLRLMGWDGHGLSVSLEEEPDIEKSQEIQSLITANLVVTSTMQAVAMLPIGRDFLQRYMATRITSYYHSTHNF